MKKLLIPMLTLACGLTVGAMAACTPTEDDTVGGDISIMNFWAGNEDEETYTIVNNTDGSLDIKYVKSGAWQYARRSFAYETAEQLAAVNTLVLEGTMTTSTNDPVVTLKIEYNGDIAAKEVTFTMSETSATYEWDLSEADLENASRLVLFAEGNRVEAEGTIHITKMTLTSDAINPENDIEDSGEEPVEQVVNEITASDATFNGGWYDSGDSVYTITKDGDAYDVTYDKKANSYASIRAIVTGSAIADYKTVRLTVQGTAGERVIVKPFDKVEVNHLLTGGEDEIIVDITGVTDVDYTTELPVLVMIQPGEIDVTGTFTILNAEFSTEEAPEEEVQQVNTITATDTAIDAGWYDNGDNVYTVTADGTAYDVAYASKTEYAAMKALVTGEAIKDMKSVVLTVQGTAGKEIMLKPFDNNTLETRFTFTGEAQELVVDISSVVADLDTSAQLPIIIMVEPGVSGASGEFTILSAAFSTEEAPEDEDPQVVNTITADNTTINGGWYDNGDNVYAITKDGSAYNVAYTKGAAHSYSAMKALVTGAAIADMKTLEITVKGTAGESIIVKPFDKIEKTFELTGNEDTFIVDVTTVVGDLDTSAQLPVIIMIQPGLTSVNGAFSILNCEFSTEEAPTTPEEPGDEDPQVVNTITADNTTINGGWYDNGDNTYVIVKEGTVYNITYTKGATHSYTAMKALVTGAAIANMKTVEITLKGTAGESVIIKPFDRIEKTFTFTGNEDTFVVDITSVVGSVDTSAQLPIIIMIQPGATGVNGTFSIINCEFSTEEAAEVPEEPGDNDPQVTTITSENTSFGGWVDGGDGKYTVVEENGTYEITKAANGSWAQLKAYVTGAAIGEMSKLEIKVSGVQGDYIIAKLGTVEAKLEPAETDETTLTIDLSQVTGVDYTGTVEIIFFFNWDATTETSFTIESAQFVA